MNNINFNLKINQLNKVGYFIINLPFEIDEIWEKAINSTIDFNSFTKLRMMAPSIKSGDLYISDSHTMKTRGFPCSNIDRIQREIDDFKKDFCDMIKLASEKYKQMARSFKNSI